LLPLELGGDKAKSKPLRLFKIFKVYFQNNFIEVSGLARTCSRTGNAKRENPSRSRDRQTPEQAHRKNGKKYRTKKLKARPRWQKKIGFLFWAGSCICMYYPNPISV